MHGLSNGRNIFDLWWPLKVKGQGQTLKTLKSNISKTVCDQVQRYSPLIWARSVGSRSYSPPGAHSWRHHHEEGPPSAGHMRWITWWVLRPFLVDFTITASATTRLLRWRQYACLEGLQRRQLPQRASGQRFVSATGGIFWHTGRRAARTIRYHATRPPRQTRSVSNCTSPMSADYTLVRCRLCQGQAPNKGVRTAVLEDKAGFWSVGLDWTSQEETTTVRRQTKSVLGEENFRQQGRPQETMAASFGCSTKGQIETSEFRWADCRAILGCLPGETRWGAISDCICCPTGLQWTTMCFQHGGIRTHWFRCCTTSHQQCSMQVIRAWPNSYLGHSEIRCGTVTVHRRLV